MLREVAEYPNSFVPLDPDEERIATGRFTLCMGRAKRSNTVQRQRFRADETDEVLAETRSLLLTRGRTRTQWEIGSRAEPQGLAEMLLARGLVRDEEPYAIAMVLSEEPPPGPPGVEAREVRTVEEFAAATEVQLKAFGNPAEELAERRGDPAERLRSQSTVMHAAWIDGRLVAAGRCSITAHGAVLFGGATLPEARGRGAYRALVRARWDHARAAGRSALLTQAGSMSRPILERLGFRPVGRIDMLIDDFGARERVAV